MKAIDLSIVTINYNNLAGLRRTLESVFLQSATNFEHIIVDGLSTDGSKEYLESFVTPRFKFSSEKDEGIYYAQNKGIEKSQGKYILFLNSGDTLANENTIEEISSYQLDSELIYGDMYIESLDNIKRLGKQPKKLSLSHLLLDTIWHPACLIRRDLFEKFGLYNTNFKIVADYEFWLRIYSSKSITTKYIPVVFSSFNLDGISSDPKNRTKLIQERKKSQELYYTRIELFFFRDILMFFEKVLLYAKLIMKKLFNSISRK
ncbi:glycosyltransferase [Leptospira sp. 201903070]|uniref:Glycosyltransferase n=1 Tax=Leptospira ainlahdjerensis TaxID=2810033 RepID=A0ABS2UA92_9LEPT|nr:glycosyltransferase family 2 protein [Leptospira ainlahdjerensis]MBM9577276.1 glycosyltransferase [Leptospira ainlahdjerensis]